MKQLFLFLALVGVLSKLPAQLLSGCSYDGSVFHINSAQLHSFDNSTLRDNENHRAILDCIQRVVDETGLQPNFVVKRVDVGVPNAGAVIENGQRYIVYNYYFISTLRKTSNWALLAIILHEIAHHLNGDPLIGGDSNPQDELYADYYSGRMLCRLGCPNLERAQEALNDRSIVPNPEGSATHPPVAQRLAKLEEGFRDARCNDRCAGLEFPEMVPIPAGSFTMGSNDSEADGDESPPHRVQLDAYLMAPYETTVAEFAAFVEVTGYRTEAEDGDGSYIYEGGSWEKRPGINWRHDAAGKLRPRSHYNHPVIHISWNDAVAYCNWRSECEGLEPVYTVRSGETTIDPNANGYRLPTEAEWEYAAGGGSSHTRYSWGNGNPSGRNGGNVADEASKRKFNWSPIFDGYDDGYVYTAPVGSYNPNALGLYDVTGNVWELCQDRYGSDYYATCQRKGTVRNPQGPDTGSYRVRRGGSWNCGPRYCRVAYRSGYAPARRGSNLGFRLARTP